MRYNAMVLLIAGGLPRAGAQAGGTGSCRDPQFPYAHKILSALCYSKASYASGGGGPCGSWCTNDIKVGSGCGSNTNRQCKSGQQSSNQTGQGRTPECKNGTDGCIDVSMWRGQSCGNSSSASRSLLVVNGTCDRIGGANGSASERASCTLLGVLHEVFSNSTSCKGKASNSTMMPFGKCTYRKADNASFVASGKCAARCQAGAYENNRIITSFA